MGVTSLPFDETPIQNNLIQRFSHQLILPTKVQDSEEYSFLES